MPTRNRPRFLQRALQSALAQEAVDLEVIVVDDASTDETPEVLAEADDARVRVLRNAQPQGVARARNTAIAKARGAWFAFLDDDDLWAPTKLRAQLEHMEDGVALVYCGVVFVDGAGRALYERRPPREQDVGSELKRWNVVGGPSSVLAAGRLVRACRGFDERLAVFADWDLWLRLAELGQVAATRDVLVAYALHSGNMHAADRSSVLRELDLLRRKHGLDVDPVRLARWIAGAERRSGRRLQAACTYAESAVRDRNAANLWRAIATVAAEPLLGVARRLLEPAARRGPEWLQFYR
jgi:glycosyltransferase involved in cell wall biosynthesis